MNPVYLSKINLDGCDFIVLTHVSREASQTNSNAQVTVCSGVSDIKYEKCFESTALYKKRQNMYMFNNLY